MLGLSPIKWRQRPDMTFAVDNDVFSINLVQRNKKNQLSSKKQKMIIKDIPPVHQAVSFCVIFPP